MNDTKELPDGDGHWMREEGGWDILVRGNEYAGWHGHCRELYAVGKLPPHGWRRATAGEEVTLPSPAISNCMSRWLDDIAGAVHGWPEGSRNAYQPAKLASMITALRARLAEAEKERDGWHRVVKDCERAAGAHGTAKSPLDSNLPNIVRDLKHGIKPPVPREQSVRCFKCAERPNDFVACGEREAVWFDFSGPRAPCFGVSYWTVSAILEEDFYSFTELPYSQALAELEASWPEGAAELRRLAGESDRAKFPTEFATAVAEIYDRKERRAAEAAKDTPAEDVTDTPTTGGQTTKDFGALLRRWLDADPELKAAVDAEIDAARSSPPVIVPGEVELKDAVERLNRGREAYVTIGKWHSVECLPAKQLNDLRRVKDAYLHSLSSPPVITYEGQELEAGVWVSEHMQAYILKAPIATGRYFVHGRRYIRVGDIPAIAAFAPQPTIPAPREQSVRCFKNSFNDVFAMPDTWKGTYFCPRLQTRAPAGRPAHQLKECEEITYAEAEALLAPWPEGAEELRRLAHENAPANALTGASTATTRSTGNAESGRCTTDNDSVCAEVANPSPPVTTYSGQELEAGVWAELYEDGSGADYIELPNHSNHGELKIGRRYIRVGDIPKFGEGE